MKKYEKLIIYLIGKEIANKKIFKNIVSYQTFVINVSSHESYILFSLRHS